MAGKKAAQAPVGQSYADESAAAASLTRGNPNAMPLQQAQPPVTAKPITVPVLDEPPAEGGAAPRDVTKMPRLRKVVLRDAFAFDNASHKVSEIDMSSEFYRGIYRRLEFGMFLGRLHVVIERKKNDVFVVYRVPFEAIVCFATYDDNPKERPASISVNEGPALVAGAAGA